jgi:hypothetical protein
MIIESVDHANSKKIIVDETFALKDTMKPQIFVFKNRTEWRIVEVDIYVTDTYPGEEWQDVCISGFQFISDNYLVPVKLNPECEIDIKWYCENKMPVIGRWFDGGSRGNNPNGIVYITYDGEDRIKWVKIYFAHNEYVEDLWEIICSYIYSDNKITVYDETNKRRMCEYVFQDGKLIYERRGKFSYFRFSYDDSIDEEFIYTNGKSSSDNLREFVARDDQYSHDILRMEYKNKLLVSEHDVYNTNGVIVNS